MFPEVSGQGQNPLPSFSQLLYHIDYRIINQSAAFPRYTAQEVNTNMDLLLQFSSGLGRGNMTATSGLFNVYRWFSLAWETIPGVKSQCICFLSQISAFCLFSSERCAFLIMLVFLVVRSI